MASGMELSLTLEKNSIPMLGFHEVQSLKMQKRN
jgi:hypothetical protein